MADSLSTISIENLTYAVNSLLTNPSLPLSVGSDLSQYSSPAPVIHEDRLNESVQVSSTSQAPVSLSIPKSTASGVRFVAGQVMLAVNKNGIASFVPNVTETAGVGLQIPADNNVRAQLPATVTVDDPKLKTTSHSCNILPAPSILHSNNIDKHTAVNNDQTILDLATIQALLYNARQLNPSVENSVIGTQSTITHDNQSQLGQEVHQLLSQQGLSIEGVTSESLSRSMQSLETNCNNNALTSLLHMPTNLHNTYTVASATNTTEKDGQSLHTNLSALQLLRSVQTNQCSLQQQHSTNENPGGKDLTNENGISSSHCNSQIMIVHPGGVPSNLTVPTDTPEHDINNIDMLTEEQYVTKVQDEKITKSLRKKLKRTEKQMDQSDIFDENSKFCVQCNMLRKEACQVHNTNYTCVQDSPVLTRARVTLPGCLYLHQSTTTEVINHLGVWSKQTIQEHSQFGPLVGTPQSLELCSNGKIIDSFHPFRFIGQGNVLLKVNVQDEDNSNWMIFVRAARSLEEQNAVTYQLNNSVYIITTVEIKPDQELLTWYSADMCRLLSLPQNPSIYKLFHCGVCGQQYSSKKLLYSHTKKCHPSNLRQGLTCILCMNAFSSRSAYATHMMGHMGMKPFPCTYCKKEFTDRSNLKTHMSIHTGEKKFQCELCNKSFRQKAHIESHMLTHTGEKKHKCLYCDKHFARESERKVHMYQHTKELCYVCATCGKTFYKTQNYKKHLKVHTGERNYMCSKCFRGFHTKYHRDRHLKICKEKNGKESSYMSLEEVAKLDNTCDAVPLTNKADEVQKENDSGSQETWDTHH